MDWITPKVAIGNYVDAQDVNILRQFRSVLGLIPTLHALRQRLPDAVESLRELFFEEHRREILASELDAIIVAVANKRIEVIELVDGPGNDPQRFRRAVETLTALAKESPPVLVHCHAGRSRSAVVVAGYLMKTLGLDPTDALNYVDARRDVFAQDVMAALLHGLA